MVPGANSEADMWRMIPDIDLLDRTLASQEADWIVITVRGHWRDEGEPGPECDQNNRRSTELD